MAEGQYKFSIGLDDKQLDLDIQQAKKAFDDLVKAARDAGAKIDKSFKNPFEGLTPPADLPQRTQAAAQSFNGLNMATQSLVRELPAVTMGLNTFFLAISNNLPIFADQIKAASAANKELQAQGQPTEGVFEQIIGSLSSWQTALTLGVTVLSIYGKEIGNWIAGLFKGKKALDATITAQQAATKAQKELNESIEKGGLGVEDEIRAYERLRREWTALNGGLKEQEQFINDNKDAFDKLGVAVNDVHDAENLLVDNTSAFLKAMRLRAQAVAAENLAVDEYQKAMQLRQREQELRAQGYEVGTNYRVVENSLFAQLFGAQRYEMVSYRNPLGEVLDQIDEAEKKANAFYDIVDSMNEESNKILTGAGITGTEGDGAAQREAEARARRIASLTKQLATDAEREATQAKIDAMAEGIDKELAQIDHDYDLREQKIREREEQLKEARGGYLTESDMAGFNALREANRAERDRARASAHSFLDSTEEDIFGDTDKAMAEATEQLREELGKRNKAWEDYIIAYGTFQERLLATQQRYDRLIAEAETEGERMALEAERDAILAEYEVQASDWAQELVDKTTEQLNAMIEELQAQVDAKQAAFDALDSSGSDDAKKYRAEINRLNAQIKELQQQLGKAKKDIGDDNWADATQVFQNISQAATDAAEGIAEFDEGAASVLRTMAQLAGTAINLIGAIQGTMKAFADGVGAIEKASGILAIIGAAIQAVSAIVGAFNSNEEATRNATIALLEYGRALEKISNTELREAFSSIFGDDSYGEFSALLRKTQGQLAELDRIKKELASKNWLGGTGVDYQFAGGYNAQGRLIRRAEKSNIDLVADMRSGWQKFWGSGWDNVAVTDLESFYENGMLNVDKLKAYYDNYKEYLSVEQRDLVEELIHEGELYAENVAAMNGYLKDLFGDLGQSISDSLLDAFKNGTDAVEAFGEAAGNVIEQLAKDVAHSAFIQPLLDLAEDKIVALRKELNAGNITNEEFLKSVTEITGDLIAGVADVQDEVNALYQYVDESAAANGIESAFDSERSGAAKGIAQASQDSVDELNGRMTAVQSHTFALVEGQKRLINDSAQILRHLAGIESNTAELRQMRVDMSAMRSDISDMATRGVIMR